jgi:hypothetical protein
MPITTRTIAKGAPPRVHKPKAKAKPRTKQANTTQPSRKRLASESESNEFEDMSKLRARKKQNTTGQQIEDSESEVELVDNAEPSDEEVESVDETHGSKEVPTEQEVSISYIFKLREIYSPTSRTALTTINVVPTLRRILSRRIRHLISSP